MFGIPEVLDQPDWVQAASELGVKRILAPRAKGSQKDPSDIALGFEAGRIGAGDSTVALLVSDVDFAYISRWLRDEGKHCVHLGMASSFDVLRVFEEAGAEIITIKKPEEASGETNGKGPKLVLQHDGSSIFEPMTDADRAVQDTRYPEIDELLQQLLYWPQALELTFEKALAKFCHVNKIGPLPLRPSFLGAKQAAELINAHPRSRWLSDPGDLAFFFPRSRTMPGTKEEIEKYGSGLMAAVARSGGPFFMRSSKGMVEAALSRLGYLDRIYNSNLGEAIDIFCSCTHNAKALSTLGVSIPKHFDEFSKKVLLHGAFMSPMGPGIWTTAPSDSLVRELLISEKLISGVEVHTGEVLKGMQAFVKRHGLPSSSTYNGLVDTVDKHYVAAMKRTRRP